MCWKCIARDKKARDPYGYYLSKLKWNAKRRDIQVLLTKEEFTQWCIENNYLEEKGREGSSATIDRIDPSKGYSIDNMQKMTKSENSRKRWVDYYSSVPF